MKLLIAILFLSSFSIAQITSGKTFVYVNKDMNFSADSVSNNLNRSVIGIYPCTTQTNNIDFSVQTEMVTTCTCPCDLHVISSPRPFFISRKGFYAMNLSKQLDLSDTTLFIKIDSIYNPRFWNGCYLPLAFSQLDTTIIINTHTNNYVLIHALPIIEADSYPECVGQTYFAGYYIKWFLQQNGTTDFSGVSQTNIAFRVPNIISKQGGIIFFIGPDSYTLSSKALVSITVYDLKGRFIRTIVNQMQEPGFHKFKLPSTFSHGAYMLSLSAGGHKVERLIVAGK